VQVKEALAYAAYAATNTFLPNVINAVTLFYGAAPCRDCDCYGLRTALRRVHDRGLARRRPVAIMAVMEPLLPGACAACRVSRRSCARRPTAADAGGGAAQAGGSSWTAACRPACWCPSCCTSRASTRPSRRVGHSCLPPQTPIFQLSWPPLALLGRPRCGALASHALRSDGRRPALTMSVPVILTVADGPPTPLQHKRPALPRRSQAPGDRVRVGQGRIWPTLP